MTVNKKGMKEPPLPVKIGCVGAIIVVMGLLVWWVVSPSDDSDYEPSGATTQPEQKDLKKDALFTSYTCIRNVLKSPSTAKFGLSTDAQITEVNDSTFSVNHYVDSQNSFSAVMRTYYTCTIILHSNGKHFCTDIETK